MRALKGLEEAIGVSVVHWLMREHGWIFAEGPGTVPDTVNGAAFLHRSTPPPTRATPGA